MDYEIIALIALLRIFFDKNINFDQQVYTQIHYYVTFDIALKRKYKVYSHQCLNFSINARKKKN